HDITALQPKRLKAIEDIPELFREVSRQNCNSVLALIDAKLGAKILWNLIKPHIPVWYRLATLKPLNRRSHAHERWRSASAPFFQLLDLSALLLNDFDQRLDERLPHRPGYRKKARL